MQLDMRRDSAQLGKSKARDGGLRWLVTPTCAAVVLAGCAVQKKPAIPWATAVLVRPATPQQTASGDGVAETPDMELAIPEPDPVFVPRSGPVRPRTYPPAANREAHTEKPETPQIVPELSPGESSELQRETEQNLSDAERNVAAASQKTLSATQSDLASKVRGFIADAREAGKVGDWSRARDLAKKAQVLAQELANSL
jgi:hypothetical protein